MRPENEDPADRTAMTATDARQGITRHGVRYVLIGSLLLAVLALIVAFFAA